jgi:ABC-type multidrug transport system fused ATPase/permease subunit
VIILDEATSALDSDTERKVMEAIGELSDDLTVIIVAHRLSTLKNCTQIVELTNGNIARVCAYEEILE